MTAILDDELAEIRRACAELQRRLDEALAERDEGEAQKAAMAEILEVINSSPGNLTPVFDAMLEKATRLCRATFGQLATYDGRFFRFVAVHGDAPFVEEQQAKGLLPPSVGVTWPRIMRGEGVVHMTDVMDTDLYRTGQDGARRFVDAGGGRSLLSIALRKGDTLLGVLSVYRQEVRPFSEKQIALAQNFAAQAVIAMENARLITETREALEQQTATAEVLQVINSSPGDLGPVFDAILEKAHILCGADFGGLLIYDGECLKPAAQHNMPSRFTELIAKGFRPGPDSNFARLMRGERYAHVHDMKELAERTPDDGLAHSAADVAGIRTQLMVALHKDDKLLGVITANRRDVRPFSDTQIALLQNFAAQAVIAMENARLITETHEALEQQTATAEVLRVINSSPGDLAPVFDAILEKAHMLCGAPQGSMFLREGDKFRAVTTRGMPEPFAERLRQGIGPDTPVPKPLIAGEPFVHIPDMAELDHPMARLAVDVGAARSVLAVPLRKGDALFGMIVAGRREATPFSDKQITLLQNFASQAVVAMENARLLTETREALEQQTATAEVLQVINSSPGDLAPVFDTMLEKATRLSDAAFGIMQVYDGEQFRTVATRRMPPALAEFLLHTPRQPTPHSAVSRILDGEDFVQFEDMRSEQAYLSGDARQQAFVELGGTRTYVAVALRKDGRLLGTIATYRREVRPFSDKQIALLQSFAAQAVIAMENARLISETREALEHQTATAEVLQVINSSPGDLAPVFDAMLERAMRLCDGKHGYMYTHDGERLRTTAVRGEPQFVEFMRGREPIISGTPLERAVLSGGAVYIADCVQEEVYRTSPGFKQLVDLGGIRTGIILPLFKEAAFLGSIHIFRQEVRPFTDKQITLLQNYAAQGVIAIENARLISETREALDQQTATAEVLQVINSSPGELAPVFNAMLEKAMRLCGAEFGEFFVTEGEQLRAIAVRGVPATFAEFRHRNPAPPVPGSITARILTGEPVIHVADVKDDDLYRRDDLQRRALVDLGGARTFLSVTLIKDRTVLGSINIYRQEVRPFSDKQIALLQNFAAQAVIAMENARLITETREALDQQTATAEVLQVINSSPGNLAPVFNAMLEKATSLCGAAFGVLWIVDADQIRAAASHEVPVAYRDFLTNEASSPGPKSGVAQTIREKSVLHFVDAASGEAYRSGDPFAVAAVELGGVRTLLNAPLIKDGNVLGILAIYREEVRPFTAKQIALLENFAAQAVIAMENARLITETREALEQQTATAEVLQVINSSPGDLRPVFDAILEKAHALCDATRGTLFLFDGETFRAAAAHGYPEPGRLPNGIRVSEDVRLAALLAGERLIHIPDLTQIDDPVARAVAERGGVRTNLLLPLRKDGALLGVISCNRQEVRPFSDKQIALLENFAAQAVVAIVNARLLEEVRQRQAELRVTFDNMGDGVVMFDEDLRLAAWNRNFQQLLDLPDAVLAERPSYSDYLRILAEGGEFGTDDIEAELSRRLNEIDQELRLERTRPDGKVIEVRRNAVPGGGFVLIYSDITERKRSEAEIHAARDAAEAAYRDLKAAQANLIQAEKMASLGQLTAGIAHEIKNPLNFVNNFAGLSVELLDELKDTAAPAITALDDDKRAEIDEVVGMLTGNLEKIAEHGKRADNIVKSMLEHSRGSSGERRSVDLNGLVEEALNLAYHGARAQDQSFNIALERDFGQGILPIELVPQDITRLCLNLFSNGFYAATKRQKEGSDPNFQPTLKVSTRDLGDAVEFRISDNGTGISAEIKDKLFQPFFTTKPTGEGTGLGLSISYDIVTQQHGGTITVDSKIGEFTEFTVRLPRAYRATMAEAAS